MKYLTLIISILIAFQVSAQEFSWGSPVKFDKEELDEKSIIKRYLIQENSEGIIRLKVQKTDIIYNEDIILEKYDANLELQKTKEILNGGASNKDFEKVVIDKDKFHLFFTVANEKMHNTLIVQTYDFDGKPIGEEKTLDIITETKAIGRGEYVIAVSENLEHYAVVTIPIFKRKTNETLKIQMFDAEFNSTFSKDFTLEYPRKRFVYNTPFVMNDGTMFMYKEQRIKKLGWVRDLYVLNKDKKTLLQNTLKLSNGNDFFNVSDKLLENEAGNLIYAGIYKKDEKMQSGRGVFYLEFDKSGKVVREVAHPFKNAPASGFNNLNFTDVQLLPNDELLFVASDYKVDSKSVGDDVNNRINTYTCNTLYFSRIKGDELVWTGTIDKKPLESTNDRARLVNFTWMYDAEADEVAVLYNERRQLYMDTRKQGTYLVAVLTTINLKGVTSSTPLSATSIGGYGNSYQLCADEFYHRDGYLIVKCTNKIDFKLGRFTL